MEAITHNKCMWWCRSTFILVQFGYSFLLRFYIISFFKRRIAIFFRLPELNDTDANTREERTKQQKVKKKQKAKVVGNKWNPSGKWSISVPLLTGCQLPTGWPSVRRLFEMKYVRFHNYCQYLLCAMIWEDKIHVSICYQFLFIAILSFLYCNFSMIILFI